MEDDVLSALEQVNQRLDYIEEHILSMSKAGARVAFVPMGRSGSRPTDPDQVPTEVVELARAGKRRDAIVRYRELTGAGPQEAIALVDSL
jgi:ribosomal protein L7/L12